MARVPTTARRSQVDDEAQNEKKKTSREKVSLASHLLSLTQPPQLGRPPKDDEEKRQVFTALAHMKSARLTNKECGEQLGLSERTIANYLVEPLYQEVQNDLQSVAKQRGYTTIASLIDDALQEVFTIMKSDKSGFVRYKAAELLLNMAGYNMPREERQRDSREEVTRFLAMLAGRQQEQVQVNVLVNQPGVLPAGSNDEETVRIVEGEARAIPQELERYYQTVLPGGKMPGSAEKKEPLPGLPKQLP